MTETPNFIDAGVINKLTNFAADVFVVASFGLLLPRSILALPKKLSINIHPSLLPKYRGAAPIHWTLMSGDTRTGVCIIQMTEKLDAGDIILKKELSVSKDETIYSLETRLAQMGAVLVVEALDQLEKNNVKLTAQDESLSSYARKLTKEDGRVDWQLSSEAIHSRVRALLDWPGSFVFYQGKRIVILKTQLEKSGSLQKPGQVLTASAKEGLVVMAGEGAVRIEELQLEGRKKMGAQEFLAGFAIKPGAFFE